MKLSSLNPTFHGGDEDGHPRLLVFDCPCGCTEPDDQLVKRRITITLKPKNPNGWFYDGRSITECTINPSIRYSPTHEEDGHWHGFITNGEVTHCSDSKCYAKVVGR